MADQINKASVLPPWGLDAGSDKQPAYTGADVSRLFSGLFNPGKAPTVPKVGRLNGLKLSVSGNTVTVGEGTGLVGIGQTVGLCGLRSLVKFTAETKHATFDRVDRAYLKVDSVSSSGRGGSLVYSAGVPSGDPSAPPLPAGALDLGTVRVPASGSISIVSQGPWASLNSIPNQDTQTVTSSSYDGTLYLQRVGSQASITFANFGATISPYGVFNIDLPDEWRAQNISVGLLYRWSQSDGVELFTARVYRSTVRIFGPANHRLSEVRGDIPFTLE